MCPGWSAAAPGVRPRWPAGSLCFRPRPRRPQARCLLCAKHPVHRKAATGRRRVWACLNRRAYRLPAGRSPGRPAPGQASRRWPKHAGRSGDRTRLHAGRPTASRFGEGPARPASKRRRRSAASRAAPHHLRAYTSASLPSPRPSRVPDGRNDPAVPCGRRPLRRRRGQVPGHPGREPGLRRFAIRSAGCRLN